jgi:hypothetical protein
MSTRTPGNWARHRIAAAALAAIGALAIAPGAWGTASAAPGGQRPQPASHRVAPPASRHDPKKSVPPSQRFFDACFNVTRKAASQRACERAALPDFDKVRATEGMARMSLPTSFPSMSATHQLLVLVNIERADRGVKVFPGLSKRLNGYAEKGAKAGTDPPFPSPFPGDSGGGNWAGVGTSTLLADYVWMYYDGVHSFNADCGAKSDPGCWGHRHNIIHAYHGPRAIGVAVAQHGGSMTQLFIGADPTDHPAAPLWTTLERTLQVGVSKTHPTVSAQVGGSGHVTLTLWASGEAMHVRAALTAGSPIWVISRSSCRLAAGTACRLTVTAKPTSRARHHATLRLTGPNGSRLVHLTERPTG